MFWDYFYAICGAMLALFIAANSNRLIVKVKVRDFEELEKQGGAEG